MSPSSGSGDRRRRILFFAEAVTLAHVARIDVLAGALDPARYDVVVACARRAQRFLTAASIRFVDLPSIESSAFMAALARGAPVYDAETLTRYVNDDLALISAVQPDLVVGDFRLSLSVSARQAGVRFATVTNAYWSPCFRGKGFPMPVLPLTRALPLPIARGLFEIGRPFVTASHCGPLNSVRRRHGLPPLGRDLRRVYTDADHVLYADTPAMFPLADLPSHHAYLGPLLWSPPDAVPSWWPELAGLSRVVYVSLGSSGSSSALEQVVEALRGLEVTVIASTAGGPVPSNLPPHVRMAPFLPGLEAARRADLVVCNGGSLTCQQALSAGVPVLGIAMNMDQFLNMSAVERVAAGRLLRADRLRAAAIASAVSALLDDPAPRAAAQRLRDEMAHDDAPAAFRAWVERLAA